MTLTLSQVRARSAQPRTVLALSAKATDSLLHIHIPYCLKYRRRRNSEAQVGHVDQTLASTNAVSTRFCLIFEYFSCILTVFETYLAGIWAVWHSHIRRAIDTVLLRTFIRVEREREKLMIIKIYVNVMRRIMEISYFPRFFGN